MPWRSLRSPPALNAFSPAPVRITQRRSPGVNASGPNTVRRSSEIAVLSAFSTSGRLKVTTMSPGSGSATVRWRNPA